MRQNAPRKPVHHYRSIHSPPFPSIQRCLLPQSTTALNRLQIYHYRLSHIPNRFILGVTLADTAGQCRNQSGVSPLIRGFQYNLYLHSSLNPVEPTTHTPNGTPHPPLKVTDAELTTTPRCVPPLATPAIRRVHRSRPYLQRHRSASQATAHLRLRQRKGIVFARHGNTRDTALGYRGEIGEGERVPLACPRRWCGLPDKSRFQRSF